MVASNSRLTAIAGILAMFAIVGIGIWWMQSKPTAPTPPPRPSVTTPVGTLEFSSPLILALEPAETKQTEVSLKNTGVALIKIHSAESNCTCTQVVSFPKAIPAGGTATLILSSLGAETGQSQITLETSAGAFQLAVMTHVRGNLPDPREALQERIALYKSSGYLWIGVLHDLRGHYENCGCSAHALGGLPAIFAAEKDLLATDFEITWLATGDPFGTAPRASATALMEALHLNTTFEDYAIKLPQGFLCPIVTGHTVNLGFEKNIDCALHDGMGVDWIVVTADGKFVDHFAWLVDARMPQDADVQAKVAAYIAANSTASTPAGAPEPYTVSNPSLTCKACHANTYAVWEKSAHARAIESLKTKHADGRQDCLACHTTPAAAQASPLATQPPVANVHCQSCHGGSNLPHHPIAPQANPLPKTFTCGQCHTATANPDFNLVAAWRRIQCLPAGVESSHAR